MPYCPRCGVEAGPEVRSCPLCTTAIPEFVDLEPGEPSWPAPGFEGDPSRRFLTTTQWQGRTFLGLTSVLVTAAITVALADLLFFGQLTWSRWPLASLLAALLYAAAVFGWSKSPAAWFGAWTGVTLGFLLTLDLLAEGRLNWAPTLGVPIALVTFGLVWLGAVVLRRSRRLGYNLFALIPGLVAVELVAIDALVTNLVVGNAALGWSVITSLVLVPIALLFLLLHYALAKTPDLKRIFHF